MLSYKDKNNLYNVTFYGHVIKDVLLSIIPEIDIGLIPLKNLPIFEGAIPSKIFDILAHKKPILLGVKGEAKQIFIDQAKAGYYFEPENENDMVEKKYIKTKNELDDYKKTFFKKRLIIINIFKILDHHKKRISLNLNS